MLCSTVSYHEEVINGRKSGHQRRRVRTLSASLCHDPGKLSAKLLVRRIAMVAFVPVKADAECWKTDRQGKSSLVLHGATWITASAIRLQRLVMAPRTSRHECLIYGLLACCDACECSAKRRGSQRPTVGLASGTSARLQPQDFLNLLRDSLNDRHLALMHKSRRLALHEACVPRHRGILESLRTCRVRSSDEAEP